MNLIEDKKTDFEKSIQFIKNELSGIRTGRASPSLVENLIVDYYNTKTPLIQLASITIPDPKSIIIQPWDRNSTKDIEKAIQTSSLGLTPINDGNMIRLVIPPLSEERRKELMKLVHQKLEQARVSIRNVREEIWKELKTREKDGKISEDDMFKQQKELQKFVDEYNGKIKEIGENKEKEIMTI